MSLFTDINKILIDGHSKPFKYSFHNSYELFDNLTIEDEKIAVQEILKGIKPTNKKSWDNICSISKKWKEKTGGFIYTDFTNSIEECYQIMEKYKINRGRHRFWCIEKWGEHAYVFIHWFSLY